MVLSCAFKIFLQSFLSTQSSKQLSWLQATAKEADLVVDEELIHDLQSDIHGRGGKQNNIRKKTFKPNTQGGEEKEEGGNEKRKKLESDRRMLKILLSEPWDMSSSRGGSIFGGAEGSQGRGRGGGKKKNKSVESTEVAGGRTIVKWNKKPFVVFAK
jgi:hypothetical protein